MTHLMQTLSNYLKTRVQRPQAINVDISQYTRWNDKIVVQKKTTLQIYFKTFIEKNQFS